MMGTLARRHFQKLVRRHFFGGVKMKRSLRLLATSLIAGGAVTALSGAAFADLIGGTYSKLTLSTTTWPGAPVYTSLANGSGNLSTATTAQGYSGAQDANADGTLL